MELRPHKPGVVAQLDDLHKPAIGRDATDHHAVRCQHVTVVIVELKAVAVTLTHRGFAISKGCLTARYEHAGVRPQAHRAALFGDAELTGHKMDHRVLAE